MSGSKGFAGVYETLSRQKSTEEHKALSASLRKAMRERGFFETEAMGTRRKEVVKTITKVPCSNLTQSMLLLSDPNHFNRYARIGSERSFWPSPCTPRKILASSFSCASMAPTVLTRTCPTLISTPLSCEFPLPPSIAFCRCSSSAVNCFLSLLILCRQLLFVAAHPRVQCVEVHRQRHALPRTIQALRSHATHSSRPSRIAQVHHRC